MIVLVFRRRALLLRLKVEMDSLKMEIILGKSIYELLSELPMIYGRVFALRKSILGAFRFPGCVRRKAELFSRSFGEMDLFNARRGHYQSSWENSSVVFFCKQV